jgi:hypothetical protein
VHHLPEREEGKLQRFEDTVGTVAHKQPTNWKGFATQGYVSSCSEVVDRLFSPLPHLMPVKCKCEEPLFALQRKNPGISGSSLFSRYMMSWE